MELVFGSYTCPKLRGSAADLKRIAQANRAAWIFAWSTFANSC
jgi:hypothetical protein